MSDSGEMGSLALVDPGKWVNGMNEEDIRRILGRRMIGEDEIMAVVFGLAMWGGYWVDERRRVTIDCKSFRLWIDCLCNRVLDQEACEYLKAKYDVDVEPDRRIVHFDIPADLVDDPLLKKAKETAAVLNFGRREEVEAKRNWRQAVKRHREELKEQEAPPTRRTRWDSDDEFAVEEAPDFYEDCVSFILCCFSVITLRIMSIRLLGCMSSIFMRFLNV
jgi:hypothetical protein